MAKVPYGIETLPKVSIAFPIFLLIFAWALITTVQRDCFGFWFLKFWCNRWSGGFSPNRRNVTTLWLFWLSCPVLSYPYLFSRSCAQVEPLDRFSCFMAQTTCLQSGARTLQTDRRQTDGRTTTYSEREREFTFAKNGKKINFINSGP